MGSCSKDFTVNDQTDYFSDDRIETLVRFPEAAMKFSQGIESGAYNAMRKSGIAEVGRHEDFGQKAVDIMMDVMGNDMVLGRVNWFAYGYTYQDRLANGNTATIYNYYSKLAHYSNLTIQSLIKSNPNYEQDVIYGRALGLRAFAHFYLLRLYEWDGKALAFEYVDGQGNIHLKPERASVEDFKDLILTDLLTAYDVLEGYDRGNSKDLIDQSVVAGILSRYYLYTEEFELTKEFAEIALKGDLSAANFNTVNANNFTSLNNSDWIWGSFIDGASSTIYASYFSHMDSFNKGYGRPTDTPKSVDRRLYDAMSDSDIRKSEWFADGVKSYSSQFWLDGNGDLERKVLPKYINTKFIDKSPFEGDYLYMRKTELFFNYMEAAFRLGDDATAQNMLNDYMSSRDSEYSSTASGEELFKQIQIQKRIELWGEGFSLLDMKRWGVGLDRTYEGTNHVIPGGLLKIDYPSNQFILQIPEDDIYANPSLRPQNPVN